jgi:c-di-GMP-related signal transduction protein
MDTFVARQAILNRQKELYAYELLFRSNLEQNSFDGKDSSSATSQVISNTLFSAGLEGILAGKKGFINFDKVLLIKGAFSILPKETLVIEILESVEPDEELVGACARLCSSGYTIALDDFVDHPKFEPLVRMAHIIKIDVLQTPRLEQTRLVEKYSKQGIRMLAEKVETLEEFESALSIGFDYFQGYFFTKPVVVRGRQISTSKISCLRLLQEAQREEMDFDKLRELIQGDVSFSYKLLRYTNSAMFAHQPEIRTIDQALMAMGEEGIRRWIAIAALPALAKDKPTELMVQSLLRARFAERLAWLAGCPVVPNWFMMGLFSLLDALLDRPIEYALQQIRLAPPVEAALLGVAPQEDWMAAVYSLIRGYEAGDWEIVKTLAEHLKVSVDDIGAAYVGAAAWVTEATSAAGN